MSDTICHIMPKGPEGRTLCSDRSLVPAIAKGLRPALWPPNHGQVSKPEAYDIANCADCRALAGLPPTES